MASKVQHQSFSVSEKSFEELKQVEETRKLLLPGEPFTKEETTFEETNKRIKRALKDYWFFDKTYFPEEMYGDGYFPTAQFHKDIVKICITPGFHIVFGPRDHGKTVTTKKVFLWKLLSGRTNITGTYAETLSKSSNIMRDVCTILEESDRLQHDFGATFIERNERQTQFRLSPTFIKDKELLKARFIAAFSEERSMRGYTRLFGRPQDVLADDVETLESSLQKHSVQMRTKKLLESFDSMSKGGSFVVMGNDFTQAGALHRMKVEFEDGLLPPEYKVYSYKAWTDNGPLWKSRFPAKSEAELKRMVKVKSQSDWMGNYQQNPTPPEGDFFDQRNYAEAQFPDDAIGIMYCDPNLSKKGKGDTTAITVLLYSRSTMRFYIVDAVCKSFSGTADLLSTLLALKEKWGYRVTGIGFDGHVAQESTWSDAIKNYCRIHNIIFPKIEFKKYALTAIAKNFQLAYDQAEVLFPVGFAKSPVGKEYLAQFWAFEGEKKSGKDDAPDSAICAYEFIHERKIVRRSNPIQPRVISDYYTI